MNPPLRLLFERLGLKAGKPVLLKLAQASVPFVTVQLFAKEDFFIHDIYPSIITIAALDIKPDYRKHIALYEMRQMKKNAMFVAICTISPEAVN